MHQCNLGNNKIKQLIYFHSPLEGDEINKEILQFKDKIQEENIHNRTKHIIISPKCFKKSLMMLKTKKSEEIRDYYVELEEICKDYIKYQLKEKNKLLEESKQELEEEKKKSHILENTIREGKIMNNNGFVYIITNGENDVNNIYKLGKSTNLNNRLSTYNGGHVNSKKFYYKKYFQCYNPKLLEQLLFNVLSSYKIYKDKQDEMYNIEYTLLEKIFDCVCGNYNNTIIFVNNLFNKNNTQSNCIKNENITTQLKPKKVKKIYPCHKCNIIFTKPSYLDKHLNLRKQPCDTKLECNRCHYMFNNIWNYNEHINKDIKCDIK